MSEVSTTNWTPERLPQFNESPTRKFDIYVCRDCRCIKRMKRYVPDHTRPHDLAEPCEATRSRRDPKTQERVETVCGGSLRLANNTDAVREAPKWQGAR